MVKSRAPERCLPGRVLAASVQSKKIRDRVFANGICFPAK